jgi:ATP/maltotriose-dependent transcriptional regulator MalT
MNALSGYFALRSRFNEGALIFGRSVEALRDSQDEPLIGSLLLRQAFFLACLGTPDIGDEAKRLADEGLRLLEHQQSAVPAEMLIVGYFCAGVVHWFSGKPEQMKDNAQISLDYAWEAEDPFGMLLAMSLLGRAEFKLGNYARAKEIGSECYDLTIKQGNKWVQGFVTFSVLAEVAFVQQEYEEAQYWCQTSQRCFEGNAEPWNLATTLMLTVCAVALRDFDKAQKQLNTCLQLLEESGLVSQIPAMLLRVARLLASQQMTEYAGAILNLVIRHPACRKETYDEAMLLLNQLEAQLPAKRSATAWVFDQSLQLTQVFEPYTATAPQPGPASSLSERELDVLVLMAEGLSNAEIGQQLYVSVGTVKVHTRHIYDKLDVNSRTQAVARARKLGIL